MPRKRNAKGQFVKKTGTAKPKAKAKTHKKRGRPKKSAEKKKSTKKRGRPKKATTTHRKSSKTRNSKPKHKIHLILVRDVKTYQP